MRLISSNLRWASFESSSVIQEQFGGGGHLLGTIYVEKSNNLLQGDPDRMDPPPPPPPLDLPVDTRCMGVHGGAWGVLF